MSRSTNSLTGDATSQPRAIVHQKILDEAAAKADSTVEELAGEVCGATPNLVERVLDEYGDPYQSEAGQSADYNSAEATEDTLKPEFPDELTEGQRETIDVIYEDPTATQREIADRLGISGATVNSRVNSIEGFNWKDRYGFAEALLENETVTDGGESAAQEMETDLDGTNPDRHGPSIADLSDQVAGLETRLDEIEHRGEQTFDDPEILHKLLHACLESDRISEEEEFSILQKLV